MFTLRHPTFIALGHPEYGDIPYFIPEELRAIAVEAGASKINVRLIDVEMPYHLAFFPLDTIGEIEDEEVRDELEEKWTRALGVLDKYGEEHPPVVVMTCWR